MDLDIEMGDAADGHHDAVLAPLPDADDILQPDEVDEPGEIADDDPKLDEDATTIVSNKINIRGVDSLHTDDIKAYVKSHFAPVDRVEWVDDTSANLVFGSDSSARDAMIALSSIEIADATALPAGETLPAKPVEGKPEVTLHVRFAVASDRKQVGAALRSRYYLLHPEHDPEERRRRQQESRSRYRDRDNSGYRRGGDRRRRDGSDEEVETFEASMYDDAPRPPTRRRSDSGDRRDSYARENRGKELFADRASRRNRSASPLRDNDGDASMGSTHDSSSRNRDSARAVKERLRTENGAKELFPSKFGSASGQLDRLEDAIGSAHLREEDMPKVVTVPVGSRGGSFNIKGAASQTGEGDTGFSIKGTANARELFPGKLGGSNAGKELFEGGRTKPRQKAQDLFG
ncbi:hypothetical protein ISF_04033 [Cordyceps fumosorosea ARSEF 2679]|uniref:Nucleotide-binding, alpha-beta plait n=1 Tax=Cordyceps fumosorosea (strain ARSEF 2679) TaxID=1081104 RepID=A0A167YD59_CORFA|nr:hypothetical protein ISF_04033 [Cordyceps fumosorosea ARSEF 2679]OAA66195.1 hypothetical protein ISF_04033 [Cordyceps fumosorosea ARSEF 2679]